MTIVINICKAYIAEAGIGVAECGQRRERAVAIAELKVDLGS